MNNFSFLFDLLIASCIIHFLDLMSCFKRVWRRLFGNRERRVLLLGLDSAGKTTVLNGLQERFDSTVPTIGFNVERVSVPPVEFLVWDVSGQDRMRSFWRHYYHGTNGIIFVIDCNDRQRISAAAKELNLVCREEELLNAVILILANKIDLPNACSSSELHELLMLDQPPAQGRVIEIIRAQANKGIGLKEGIQWLAKAMTEGEKAINKKQITKVENKDKNEEEEKSEQKS
jgi:small GTP-binding protein